MNKRHAPILILLVLLSLSVVCFSAFLLWKIAPKKQAESVSSLETDSVFVSDSAVQPEREAAYEGELPNIPLPDEDPLPPEPAEQEQSESVQPPAPSAEELSAEKKLAEMSLEEKIWQLFFVTPEELTDGGTVTRAGEDTKNSIAARPVGGVVYFSANLEDQQQVTQMLSNIQSYSEIPLFLAVDEEGGAVQRIGTNDALGGQAVGSMQSLGEAGDPSAVYSAGAALADNLSRLGFNLDFAPVADVSSGSDSVIGSRSFGSDAELCASFVGILTQSFRDRQIVSCLKHFPGYGSASSDSHTGSARLDKTLDELERCDLIPFRAALDTPFIMVCHLSCPAVTGDDTPADLSYAIVTDLLRNKMGYRNVIITDSHEMASITDLYGSGEAAVRAFEAGCDMILMPVDLQAAYDALLKSVQDGSIPESRVDESVRRILTVKAQYGLLER